MTSDRKVFSSPRELVALGIIDFGRLHGYWGSREKAVAHIGGLLCGGADYVVYEVPDFDACPVRDDWPGWSHVGGHPPIGRKLWDWFHHHLPDYSLVLKDQPDFQAIKRTAEGTHFINGDIGQVSPQAFVFAMNGAKPGDMWISVLDGGKRHVVITFRTTYWPDIPPNPYLLRVR